MAKLIIGVLGLQGAIEDHEETLRRAAENLEIDLDLRRVILPDEIEAVDGLVMPGGESTAMTLIGKRNGMLDAVRKRLADGLPAFGTCAGAILLSERVRRTSESEEKPGAFPFLHAEIFRNGYGRQKESFSTAINIEGEEFRAIFIRAPVFGELGDEVETVASVEGDPVFIRQGNIFATTFHPELAHDTRIHEMFLQSVLIGKNA
ncbi:MAG: pyridoxal 5'-phosphate synthase glutaminase subunit PdxT [Candidatus Kariarchaeaceae archaeon]|jgi:5'-phosphate synthase pdxT subunit